MNHRDLIEAGVAHLEKYPGYKPLPGLVTMFPLGARWMYDRLHELYEKKLRPFDPGINYSLYGFIKYGICVSGSFLSVWWLFQISWLLTPFSILIFYLLETQFLFLFPLLIDGAEKPVLSGMREVFRIGVIKCLLIVIPIAFFMVIGLLRKKDRLVNWYIGCLAILIWYNNEVRAGI